MTITTNTRSNPSQLLAANSAWSNDVFNIDPTFFTESAKGQAPKILWLGCADSRVAESVICACQPGQIFVHRNIANRFSSTDDSANAVLEYAVKFVGVDHVVVVGHTECGGCNAAFESPPPTDNYDKVNDDEMTTNSLSRFLAPLIELRHTLHPGATARDLVLANIKTSVEEICRSETMRDVWSGDDLDRKAVQVHGLMYDLATGRLQDLEITRGAK